MASENQESYQGASELTLRDILLSIGAFAKEIWRRKLWVLAGAIVLAGLFAWQAYKAPVTYKADLSFMINEDERSSTALNGVLGTLGLGGSGSEYNLEKVIELSRSALIMNSVLLDSATINGKPDVLANHIKNIYELPQLWEENGSSNWAKVNFTGAPMDSLDRVSRKVLKYLHRIVTLGNRDFTALSSLSANDKTSIFEFRVITINEELSYELSQMLYKKLSEFYIEKTTGNPRATFRKLQSRADSLERMLNSTEYALANRRDGTLGMDLNRDQVATSRIERQTQILSTMYGEVLRNLATAEFALSNATPFFALID
ncbi:MAG: hypothetical protein AAFP08_09285, partial [Bacteroidota bacterium]